MKELADKAFREWTEEKSKPADRISIFEHIRNINYAVLPELRNFDSGPEGLLAAMRGSCTPKHFLMGMLFERLGLSVIYTTYPYRWDDPDLRYPDELRHLAQILPVEYHLACKVNIEGRWVLVDATWDPAIAEAGFPVNTSWDGMSDTRLAVKAVDEIEHDGVRAREAFVKERKASWSKEDRVREAVFVEEFNRWLEAVRTYGG